MEKADEILEEYNIKPPKVMIGGALEDIYVEGERMENMPFTRGLIKLSEGENTTKGGVILKIDGYEKAERKIEKKLSRLNKRLEEFGLSINRNNNTPTI